MTAAVLWLTQLIASALTLAMPPLFALWIPQRFADSPHWLAALAFAAPLASGAIFAPFWGRLSDRVGRLPITIRAHLGLALALLLASFARSAQEFLLALALQGALGGTYAPGRALLVELTPRQQRARALTFFESAPRLALLFGPLMAAFVGPALLHPGALRTLALLPLLSALLLFSLRFSLRASTRAPRKPAPAPQAPQGKRHKRYIHLPAFLALFVGGGTLAPFAVDWIGRQAPTLPIPVATALALLPNLFFALYALAPGAASVVMGRVVARWQGGPGLALQLLILAAHPLCSSPASVIAIRIAYGVTYFLNWQALHERAFSKVPSGEIGRLAATLDALQRWVALGGAGTAALFMRLASSHEHLPLAAAAVSLALWLLCQLFPLALSISRPPTPTRKGFLVHEVHASLEPVRA